MWSIIKKDFIDLLLIRKQLEKVSETNRKAALRYPSTTILKLFAEKIYKKKKNLNGRLASILDFLVWNVWDITFYFIFMVQSFCTIFELS